MRPPVLASVLLVACSGPATPPTTPSNVAPAARREAMPCFSRDLELAEWHEVVRADHVLAFDVVSDAGPPPGWPDGWSAGACRVLTKFNEATTLMDYLVQDRGKTIATIGDTHVDFYVKTPLPGAQAGDTVGTLQLSDCVPAFSAWQSEGNSICRDASDQHYIVRAEGDPQPTDKIVARRLSVGTRRPAVKHVR
jgi:hypothetical protein